MKILNYKEKVWESYGDKPDYERVYEFDDDVMVLICGGHFSGNKGIIRDFDDSDNTYLIDIINKKYKNREWINRTYLEIFKHDQKTLNNFKNNTIVNVYGDGYFGERGIITECYGISYSVDVRMLDDKKTILWINTNNLELSDEPEEQDYEEWVEESFNNGFKVGDTIKHKDFGIGKVVLWDKDKNFITIQFDNIKYGKKVLFFDIAKTRMKDIPNDEPEELDYEEWVEESFRILNESGVKIVQKFKENKKPFTILKIYENKITDLNDYEYSLTQANRILNKYSITIDDIKKSNYRKKL